LSLVDGLRFEEDAQLSNDEGALKIGNIGAVSRAYCNFGTFQTSVNSNVGQISIGSEPDHSVLGPDPFLQHWSARCGINYR
jgi:hypothetical protein